MKKETSSPDSFFFFFFSFPFFHALCFMFKGFNLLSNFNISVFVSKFVSFCLDAVKLLF